MLTAAALTRKRAWAIALAATFTMTVSQLDRTTLSVLAPAVTSALAISDVGYGWLASAFSIAYLVAAPFAGWWLDRVGARRGLMISVILWSLVAALHSLTLGYATLFALRIALGAAESPSYPGSAMTVERVLPPSDRPRGFGVLFTGSSLGVMIAAPLATWLFAKAGWRIALLGSSVVGLAWVPVWLVLTRRRDVRERLEVSTLSPQPIAPRWHEAVREPALLRAIIAVFAAAPLQTFPALWGAKYLVLAFTLRQESVGRYLWIPLAVFDAATVLFGDLAARQRRNGAPPRLLFGIATALAASMVLLRHAATPMQAMTIMSVGVAGAGGMYTLIVSDLLANTKADRVGRTSGYLPAAQSLAVIIASPLVGTSVHASASYAPSALALGLWTLPGAAVWIIWRTRRG